MNSPQPIKPRDRLLAVSRLWAEATGRSPGALSSMVMNHGGALDRLSDPAKAVTDATLERFAEWLARADNWPDGAVPEEALTFAHSQGVSPDAAALSAGNAGGLSSGEKAA